MGKLDSPTRGQYEMDPYDDNAMLVAHRWSWFVGTEACQAYPVTS